MILDLTVGRTELLAGGYYLLVVFTLGLLVSRKRETAALYGWSLAVIFLPGLGMLLFYLLGLTRIPRRLQRKLGHRQDFQARFPGDGLPPPTPLPGGDSWAAVAGVAERLGAGPMREGNEVALLTSGVETFSRIFAAIERARHHVHVEKYTFRGDRLGRLLLNLLIRKAIEGVRVRVLVDAVGTLGTWRLFRRLRRAGGEGAVFLPVLPFPKYFTPNLRNHRKIVVCDGEVGFVGGINVGDEYLGRRRRNWEWLDAHLVVRGPAVLDLQRIFVEDWDFTTGRLLEGEGYFPSTPMPGKTHLQIVPSGPDQETNAARQAFFAAIGQSRESLFLASPYVVPDQSLREGLLNAAFRGVRVSLLTQESPPDHWLPYWSARYYWEELLEAGVRIFAFTPGMMHAKVIVADSAWASVGSANFDTRSLRLNFEVSAVTIERELVGRVAGAFMAQLARSRELTLDEIRRRGALARAGENLAHLFAPLL